MIKKILLNSTLATISLHEWTYFSDFGDSQSCYTELTLFNNTTNST
jgi:hypothetical protein